MTNKPASGEVTTAVRWFKSSYSAANNECVEVSHFTHGRVAVRDSKNLNAKAATTSARAWTQFVNGLDEGTM